MEKSYVSFMSNDRDIKGVLINKYQLQKFGSKYPYTCIVTEDVSDKVKEMLSYHKIKIAYVNFKDILLKLGFEEKTAIYIYNKIHFICLFIFLLNIKGVYLDADILILKNLDHLFDKNTADRLYMTNDLSYGKNDLLGNHLAKIKNKYNAGVICFESNHTLFYDMMNYLKKVTEKDVKVIEKWTDQEVFNHFINNNLINVSILDFKYNLWLNVVDFFVNTSKLIQEEDIHIIHYVYPPKPWLNNAYERFGQPIERKYWLMWLDVYRQFISNNWCGQNLVLHNKLIEVSL